MIMNILSQRNVSFSFVEFVLNSFYEFLIMEKSV